MASRKDAFTIALAMLALGALAMLALACGSTASTKQGSGSAVQTGRADAPEIDPAPAYEGGNEHHERNAKLDSILNAMLVQHQKNSPLQRGLVGQAEIEQQFVSVQIVLAAPDSVSIQTLLEDNLGTVTSIIADSNYSFIEATTPISLLDQITQYQDVHFIVSRNQIYSNLDRSLDSIVAEFESGFLSAEEAAAQAPLSKGDKINVRFKINCAHYYSIQKFSRTNGDFIVQPQISGVCTGDENFDQIRSSVPISILSSLSEQPGIIRIWPIYGASTLQSIATPTVPPAAQSHGVRPWHQKGYKGGNVKIGIIDRGFSPNIVSPATPRCYIDVGVYTDNLADCYDATGGHGTEVFLALHFTVNNASANDILWINAAGNSAKNT